MESTFRRQTALRYSYSANNHPLLQPLQPSSTHFSTPFGPPSPPAARFSMDARQSRFTATSGPDTKARWASNRDQQEACSSFKGRFSAWFTRNDTCRLVALVRPYTIAIRAGTTCPVQRPWIGIVFFLQRSDVVRIHQFAKKLLNPSSCHLTRKNPGSNVALEWWGKEAKWRR